jgi:hypothetical protein
MPAFSHNCVIFNRAAGNLPIGDNNQPIVQCLQYGMKNLNFFDGSSVSCYFHKITYFIEFEDQNEYSAGKVCQVAL